MATTTKNEAIITAKIYDIISEQLGVDLNEVTPDATLMDDLGADSLDVVDLAMTLEDEFAIEVSDEDVEKMRHVRDVTKYVVRVMQAR